MAEEVPKLLEGQDKTENRLQELEQENQKMREANAQLEVQVSEMEAKCKEAESDLHNSIQLAILMGHLAKEMEVTTTDEFIALLKSVSAPDDVLETMEAVFRLDSSQMLTEPNQMVLKQVLSRLRTSQEEDQEEDKSESEEQQEEDEPESEENQEEDKLESEENQEDDKQEHQGS